MPIRSSVVHQTSKPATSKPHRAQSSTASSVVPVLSIGSSRATSVSEAKTANASVVDVTLLDEGDDGVLVLPPHPEHQCLFYFLDCTKKFDGREEWETHVLSHFRGKPAPIEARCPFCPWQTADPLRDVAWRAMLDHVATNHFRLGHSISTSTPDPALFTFLWKRGILKDGEYKALFMPRSEGRFDTAPPARVRNGQGVSNEPCTVTSSIREERRERERRTRERRTNNNT